jgi:hypothetical protein
MVLVWFNIIKLKSVIYIKSFNLKSTTYLKNFEKCSKIIFNLLPWQKI